MCGKSKVLQQIKTTSQNVSEASLIESTSSNIEVIYEKKKDIMNERVAPAIMNRAVESKTFCQISLKMKLQG